MHTGESVVGPSRTVSVTIDSGPVPGSSSITFRSQAVPGTLAVFAGTLSAARLDIISAVVRLGEGSVSDTFDVTSLEGATIGPADAGQLGRLAEDALNGHHDLEAELRELRRRYPARIDTEPRVEVQTDSSLTTGINVVCADRPGLLYDITSTMTRFGMRVRALSVLTFSNRAHDTFRIVDSAGEAPKDPALLDRIRLELVRICR